MRPHALKQRRCGARVVVFYQHFVRCSHGRDCIFCVVDTAVVVDWMEPAVFTEAVGKVVGGERSSGGDCQMAAQVSTGA
eukprot:CAMPEP_0194270716 /NCGR_PEP_ID=MMETSP0169-20130528/4646_1 /TAXON_ID=218684 /ORGANISM="Corethron pennatum, Strain L29A3" /LENGTH=78 /DNA_ID=CAMNT_0039012853 /DNA_START=156 /DNA_END=392 /DNA_ORIENTATION=-